MAFAFTDFASERDASRLDKDLTPVVAEQMGNGKDIPAWTGGLKQSKSHKPGDFYSNPYFREKPLFIINQNNMEEQKSHLSSGTQKLLTQFPSLELPIYETH
jgi:hypothetical protein